LINLHENINKNVIMGYKDFLRFIWLHLNIAHQANKKDSSFIFKFSREQYSECTCRS